MKRVLQRLALALTPVLLLLLTAEGLVRLSGAAESCPNRFSDSDIWACDPILHFKVVPDLEPNGQPLNSDGFRSAEFGPKRPGVVRILALGDSCTFGYLARESGLAFVQQPYPLKLQRFVERRVGEDRVEVLNAALPGYNSFQGVLLLRSKLRNLEPDLITVRYGWNDHFLSARGEADLYREPESRLLRALQDFAFRSKLYAFLRRLGLELRASRQPVREQLNEAWNRQREYVPTIPIERYAANLRRIVELGRARGAEVWLLTAPRNPAPSEESRTRLGKRNRLDFERLMAIHDEYNEVVRRVGRETGALVVDMDAVYRRYPGEPVFVPSDVPHPTQGGHNLEAETLFTALVRQGIVAPPSTAP